MGRVADGESVRFDLRGNEVEEQAESKAKDFKELPSFADADTTTRFSKREAIIVEL